ncbi:hypothetical protein B0H10DRAFT_1966700 [Mycena sp. CBHHK59/15]|nr:hypothetical protein B0H10DRAFT_1966700 [Mycena sp. CBHHK59/15]
MCEMSWLLQNLAESLVMFFTARVFYVFSSTRVFIVKYIIAACVEAFHDISHKFAHTFGFSDRSRHHKGVDVGQDLRLLTETLMDAQLHILSLNHPPLKVNNKVDVVQAPSGPHVSAIIDSFDAGAQILNGGNFSEFIRSTTWAPAIGYPVGAPELQADPNDPLLNGLVSDHVRGNPLGCESFNDVDDGDTHMQRYPGLGCLSGGMEYLDLEAVTDKKGITVDERNCADISHTMGLAKLHEMTPALEVPLQQVHGLCHGHGLCEINWWKVRMADVLLSSLPFVLPMSRCYTEFKLRIGAPIHDHPSDTLQLFGGCQI